MHSGVLFSDGFVFDTYTDGQNEFISTVRELGIEKGLEWILENRDCELSYPRELDIIFSPCLRENVLELSEKADFSDARIYKTVSDRISLGNLKTGTTYHIRANGKSGSFSTKSATPRFLKVGGILNVRDIGGGKIKQGILFRGSELERCFPITDEGRETFTKELGIRTQLDLRLEMKGKLDGSSAGDSVKLVQIPYRPYSEVFLPEYTEAIKPIMELFADPESYPVYFHCKGGADRTGMIALYLRALAGEDDDTIHLDYELTGLSTYAGGITEGATGIRSRNAEYYREFIKRIKSYAYDDAPLSVAVPEFLKTCGISEDTIKRITENITK